MVPHTLHLSIVRVLHAKWIPRPQGEGKPKHSAILFWSFARQVVLTLVNSADPQKQHSCFHGILTFTARQSFIEQLQLRYGST